ncbi:MAG: hypothetical protein AAGC57_19395 [Pseudomonadota bacterium]
MIARRTARRIVLDRGFGLAEALVALLIAGGTLVAFYDAVSVGTTLQSSADRRAQMALEAFLLLDTVGVERPLRAGFEGRGRRGGYDWRVLVSGSAPEGFSGPGGGDAETLLHIYVRVEPVGKPELAYLLHALRYRERPL